MGMVKGAGWLKEGPIFVFGGGQDVFKQASHHRPDTASLQVNMRGALCERLRCHAGEGNRTMSDVVLTALKRELAMGEWQDRLPGVPRPASEGWRRHCCRRRARLETAREGKRRKAG